MVVRAHGKISLPAVGPLVIWLLALTSAGVCVAAELTEEQLAPGHVFTNADLADLEPLPTQTAPIVATPDDPDRVRAFIDRQYARLDADRRYRLEREATEAEVERLRNPPPRYGLAWAPFYPYSYHPRPKNPHHGQMRPLHAPVPGDFANRIVPLHARPTLAERGRSHGQSHGSRSGHASRAHGQGARSSGPSRR